MLEVIRSGGNAIAFRAVRSLTEDDYYKVWIPALREVIRLSGKARALLLLDDADEGWQNGTIWDPSRFGQRHAADLERLAVAADDRWTGWTTAVGKHFRDLDMRVYAPTKHNSAWGWVKA